jgi:hypothetical protein
MPRGLAASRRARPPEPVPDRTTTMVPPDPARLSGQTVAPRLRLRRQRDGLSRDGPSREPALPPDGRRTRGHGQEPCANGHLRAPSGAGPCGRRRLHTWDDVTRLLAREEQAVVRATATAERYRTLHAEGLVSRRDVEEADRAVAEARGRLDETRSQLADSQRIVVEAQALRRLAALPPVSPGEERSTPDVLE